MSIPMPLLLAFGCGLAKASGLVLTLPSIAAEYAPRGVQIAFALVVAVCLTLAWPLPPPDAAVAQNIAVSAVMGMAIGLVFRVALATAHAAAEFIGQQIGLGFSSLVDPAAPDPSSALGRLAALVAIALMFAAGLHHDLILAITAPPMWGASLDMSAASGLAALGSEVFSDGLRLAAPVLAAGLVTQFTFGLLAKVAPQMNIWAVGFLSTIFVGLVASALYADAFGRELSVLLEHASGRALSVAEGGFDG